MRQGVRADFDREWEADDTSNPIAGLGGVLANDLDVFARSVTKAPGAKPTDEPRIVAIEPEGSNGQNVLFLVPGWPGDKELLGVRVDWSPEEPPARAIEAAVKLATDALARMAAALRDETLALPLEFDSEDAQGYWP